MVERDQTAFGSAQTQLPPLTAGAEPAPHGVQLEASWPFTPKLNWPAGQGVQTVLAVAVQMLDRKEPASHVAHSEQAMSVKAVHGPLK